VQMPAVRASHCEQVAFLTAFTAPLHAKCSSGLQGDFGKVVPGPHPRCLQQQQNGLLLHAWLCTITSAGPLLRPDPLVYSTGKGCSCSCRSLNPWYWFERPGRTFPLPRTMCLTIAQMTSAQTPMEDARVRHL
jgi:hypothetical protein